MRYWAVCCLLVLGCADTTGPAVEDECRSAGEIASVRVKGVEVDTHLIDLYQLYIERRTYQLP